MTFLIKQLTPTVRMKRNGSVRTMASVFWYELIALLISLHWLFERNSLILKTKKFAPWSKQNNFESQSLALAPIHEVYKNCLLNFRCIWWPWWSAASPHGNVLVSRQLDLWVQLWIQVNTKTKTLAQWPWVNGLKVVFVSVDENDLSSQLFEILKFKTSIVWIS